MAAGHRRPRRLEAGGGVPDLAVAHRPQPPERPLARTQPPAAGASRWRGPRQPPTGPLQSRARVDGARAAPPVAARDRRPARRATRGGAAAAGAGIEPGGNRRDHRQRSGNRQVALAVCDGQTSCGVEPMTSKRPDLLTPEERGLAERLGRIAPRGAPSAELDARILGAAHAAAGRKVGPAHSRSRWPALVGIAATVALAVGVAW